MAYNLQSLVQILQQTLHPHLHNDVWILNDHDKSQLESLLELALSLEEILENLPTTCYKTTQALMSQIRDAAYIAEDIIEPYVVDQILTSHDRSITSLQFFRQPWRTLFHKHDEKASESLIPRFKVLKDRLTKVVHQQRSTSFNNRAPKTSSPGASASNCSRADDVVGLEDDLLQLQDRLTGHGTKFEVIPIVGMGGIGKTTLSRYLYNDPLIAYHFHNRAWATVSQECNLTATLLSLLGSITGNDDVDMIGKVDEQLGEQIHKSLSGKRYLVVLDDIWSIKIWDAIRRFFPQNNNGSRVILTTRELSLANYANATSHHHQMHLLNEVESWNLLRRRVFGEGQLRPDLEYLGKGIANNCKGLPLAIQVVAGLLSEKQEATFWQEIVDDVSAVVARNDERCSRILFLSYEHLPLHLRSCFLYIGGFPEDYEIQASEITRLFVAEGFLKPIKDKTLEEAAEEYLKALVDRSLLSVRKRDPTGKAKGYIIHDLIRDLCKRKAEEEKFISVRTAGSRFSSMRRLFIHPDHLNYNYHSTIINMPQFARSFVYTFPHGFVENRRILRDFKLLRVLALLTWKFKEFPRVMLKLVNIRYLALTCSSSLPSDISRLWNMQTLIFQEPMMLSSPLVIQIGLRSLTEIRHIKFMRSCYYPIESGSKQFVLEKLQTLSYVDASKFAKHGFVQKVPNLKKLGIILGSFRDMVDLSSLHRLETLKCLSGITFKNRPILAGIIFPASIKKLYLIFCKITGKFMSSVGSLPNLEVLKIRGCTMLGEDMQPRNSKWEPTLGEFASLQILQLDEFKLVHWQADERNYPSLRHLAIRKCGDLDDLPTGIGDIPTLEVIELDKHNPHLVASATRIQEEQQDLGNYSLQVLIQKGHSSNLWWTKYIYI